MDRTSLTATARKITAAMLLIAVLFTAEVARPNNIVAATQPTTTTERI